MDAQSRTHVLNVAIANVPDLAVCLVAARLTESGWSGFFITLVVLQTIYFFFWFKQALWGWLVFWFYGKRRMTEQLENSFIDSRFPPPSKYATDLDDYFSEISNNEGLDPTTRLKAAHELGTLNGLKIARRFSMILQINSAAETALKRYARLGERFAQ